jgi:pyruvate ferredoxin oxidoreductase alpha subunit
MDSTLIAYRVAEHAMVPVMINLDGFYLTHTSEVIHVPDQEAVDRFLPPFQPEWSVSVESPSTFGAVCGADLYMSLKYRSQKDTLGVEKVWTEMAEDFAARFERWHPVLDPYRMEDAAVAIVALGTASGTARLAADALRREGVAAGSLRFSMFRPFPKQALIAALGGVRHVVVIDRDVSLGAEGIVAQEIKASLYGESHVQVHGFIAGIGGVDVTVDMLRGIVKQVLSAQVTASTLNGSHWVEVLS